MFKANQFYRSPDGHESVALTDHVVSEPAAICNLDGAVEVFMLKDDNNLYKVRHVAGTPVQRISTDANFTGNVSAILNRDNRIEIFAKGRDLKMYHRYQRDPNVPDIANWTSWENLEGALESDPVVVMNQDKRLEVFAIHIDDNVHKIYHTQVGSWWYWENMPGPVKFKGKLAASNDSQSKIHVVARGKFDNAFWINFQTAANGPYSGWMNFGGVFSGDPVLMKNSDGRLELFGRGTDGKLWHRWQLTPSGNWADWKLFQMSADVPPTLMPNGRAAVSNSAGRHPHLAFTDASFNIMGTFRKDATPFWENWQNHQENSVSNLSVVQRPNGLVTIYGINNQGQLIGHSYPG